MFVRTQPILGVPVVQRQNFRGVAGLTADWPPLLILSGASRPGHWTPFDSISFA